MDKELLNEIIAYIEEAEESEDDQFGLCRDLNELIKDNAMPELYNKLLALRETLNTKKKMSNEKTQTAVEILFHKLWDTPKDKFTWYALLNEAQAMEKEQIEKLKQEIIFLKRVLKETYGGKK